MRQPHSRRQSAHSKYLTALSAIVLRRVLGSVVLGSVVLGSAVLGGVACQSSAPAESKEPAASKPAPVSAPAAQAPAAQAPAAQTAQPLKAAEVEPPAPSAVKLAGNPPAANPPAANEPTPAADAPKKGDAKQKAGDKAPAAAAPTASEKQGSVVSEDAFSAWLQTASPAKAGGPVQLEAVLVAKPPYHCNPEYPHKFKLNPAPGLTFPEETVRGMKVTPERSVLAIPVNAQSAGKPTISGTLSFSVCTAERCMVEKRDLSVALDVM